MLSRSAWKAWGSEPQYGSPWWILRSVPTVVLFIFIFIFGGWGGDRRHGESTDAPSTKVYYFTIVAMTDNHKFNGYLIQISLTVLKVRGLTGLESRCQQGCMPSGVSKGESITLTFVGSTSLLHSLVHGPSSIFQLLLNSDTPASVL